jgi:hypothetical protein
VVLIAQFQLYQQDFVDPVDEELPAHDNKEYEYDPRPATSHPPRGPVRSNILVHNFQEPHICTNTRFVTIVTNFIPGEIICILTIHAAKGHTG